MSAFSDVLQPTSKRETRWANDVKLLNATEDLGWIVGTDGESVIVEGTQIQRFEIRQADSATFLPHDRPLITAPVLESQTWDGRAQERRTKHRVILVELAASTILDEQTLDVDDARVSATPHPSDGSILLEAGEGQDGSTVFIVHAGSVDIEVEQILENVTAAGFSPTGDRLLLTPHPNFDSNAAILRWPALERMASLSPSDLDLEGDLFEFYGCFLDDDAILLKTYEHGLILCDGTLTPTARLDLTQPAFPDDIEIESVLGIGHRAFAVGIWSDGSSISTIWTLD